jgi:cytochrome c oxidase cbb3-type subunit III
MWSWQPVLGFASVAALLAGAASLPGSAEENQPTPEEQGYVKPGPTTPEKASEQPAADKLLQVPVTNLTPGGVSASPKITIPPLNAEAAQRGMQDFISFNCVGCHMGNGGGGMGPALSNRFFIYGSKPENIFLSIYQGRPHGMPAWGTVLPNEIIWDLVAYIKELSEAPSSEWGSTISQSSPDAEQVPLELNSSSHPWQYTEKFSKGQKPEGK